LFLATHNIATWYRQAAATAAEALNGCGMKEKRINNFAIFVCFLLASRVRLHPTL